MPATALEGLVPVTFVMQEVRQCRQYERTKTALLPVHLLQRLALEHKVKKTLRQILGLVDIVSSMAHESIDRIPITAAEPLERGGRRRGVGSHRRQHHAPIGG